MTEADAIRRSGDSPNTVRSLAADLRALGVRSGMTLMVHSSLSKLGWVCGGPQAVILALESVLGPGGTLVMPTHSGQLSDPARWRHPPVPESWWRTIRAEMPGFDPDLTPCRGVGAIPETFRKQKGVLRSGHPQSSVAAWGAHSVEVTRNHPLDFGNGSTAPLGRLYDLDAWVLLMGVGHDRSTSLHLAEYQARWDKKEIRDYTWVVVDGESRRIMFRDIAFEDEDFPEIGAAFEATGGCVVGRVGRAEARLMRQRALVDFAVGWIEEHRRKIT